MEGLLSMLVQAVHGLSSLAHSALSLLAAACGHTEHFKQAMTAHVWVVLCASAQGQPRMLPSPALKPANLHRNQLNPNFTGQEAVGTKGDMMKGPSTFKSLPVPCLGVQNWL